jgi:hypothetical protein
MLWWKNTFWRVIFDILFGIGPNQRLAFGWQFDKLQPVGVVIKVELSQHLTLGTGYNHLISIKKYLFVIFLFSLNQLRLSQRMLVNFLYRRNEVLRLIHFFADSLDLYRLRFFYDLFGLWYLNFVIDWLRLEILLWWQLLWLRLILVCYNFVFLFNWLSFKTDLFL